MNLRERAKRALRAAFTKAGAENRREGSDYTVWRETLWEGLSVREISYAVFCLKKKKHTDVYHEAGH